MSDNERRGWIITFAGMGVNLCLGVLYSWSVFAKALVDQLHWTKTDASIPYMIANIVFATFMVPAGRVTDKWGPRIVITLGGIFAGGGMILASLSQNLGLMIACFGVLVGIGIGMGYAAATPAAVKWFGPHRKGLISGIVVAGFGLGSVYIAPLTNYLIKFGIDKAFLIEGILFLVAIVLIAQLLSFPPKGYSPAPAPVRANAQRSHAGAATHEHEWHEMMKTPSFYVIWFIYFLGAFAGLMIIGHLAKIADVQVGIKYGFVLVALLAILNAGGRVCSGWMGDKIGRSNTLLIVLLIQAVNMFFFRNYTSVMALMIGVLIAGYCYGSLLSLFPSITYEFYGTKNAGMNYGIIFTAWGVGGVMGPIVAGKVADMTGAYHQAYIIASILCLAGALLTRLIRPPKSVREIAVAPTT
jgi:MFS transporter, OFA family, oxalate/formate antiporter